MSCHLENVVSEAPMYTFTGAQRLLGGQILAPVGSESTSASNDLSRSDMYVQPSSPIDV